MAQRTLPAPAAYLQRIARNLLYDRSKRMEVRLAQFHVPIGEGCEPTIEASQHHELEGQDVMRVYRRAPGQLPDRTRAVFLLPPVAEYGRASGRGRVCPDVENSVVGVK